MDDGETDAGGGAGRRGFDGGRARRELAAGSWACASASRTRCSRRLRPLFPGIAAQVPRRTVDDTGWAILAANAGVSAKLRQIGPRLEAALLDAGTGRRFGSRFAAGLSAVGSARLRCVRVRMPTTRSRRRVPPRFALGLPPHVHRASGQGPGPAEGRTKPIEPPQAAGTAARSSARVFCTPARLHPSTDAAGLGEEAPDKRRAERVRCRSWSRRRT